MKRGSSARLAHLIEGIEMPSSKDGTQRIYRQLYVVDGNTGLYRRVRPKDDADRPPGIVDAWHDGGLICLVRALHVETELREAGIIPAAPADDEPDFVVDHPASPDNNKSFV